MPYYKPRSHGLVFISASQPPLAYFLLLGMLSFNALLRAASLSFFRSQLKCHSSISRLYVQVCPSRGPHDSKRSGRTAVDRSHYSSVARPLPGRLSGRPRRGGTSRVPVTESSGRRSRPGVRHRARSTGGGARSESRGLVAYALLGRGKMADGKGDAAAAGAGAEAPAGVGAGDGTETESMARGHSPASPVPGASGLRPCLWQLETELREQEVSEVSSLNYCRSFCQVRGGLAG